MSAWIRQLCLGIFLTLFGVFAVTNLSISWGRPVMGFAAGIAGVLILLDVFQS